jgi:hypothetical protein
MPHAFKVYDSVPIDHVGKPIAIVATIQPAETNVLRLEWYLFVLSNPNTLGYQTGNVINTTVEVAKVADPTGTALGEIIEYDRDAGGQ